MSFNGLELKRNSQSYSIWLMPDGIDKDQLKTTILSLASDFDAPFFNPHVTLVGGFLGEEKQLLKKMKIISKKIPSFIISFDGIDYLNDFFRSLFLKVKLNNQLIRARDIASNELELIKDNYMPHLSLIYGNYNSTQKKHMISKVSSIPISFSVNKIFLAYNDEINLMWKVIRGFSLNK